MPAIDKADFVQNLEHVEAVLETIANLRAKPDARSQETEHLFNTVEFAVIFNADLTTCLFSLERCLRDWDKRFHARVLALLLVESSKKSSVLLGKEMRAIVRRHGSPEHSKMLKELHSEITKRASDFEHALGGLRDNAIAHRDRSAAKQLQEIRALDVSRLDADGWEMIRWLNRAYEFVSSLTKFSQSRTA